MVDLSMLNSMQYQAAVSTQGPVLILAGAGSGKTTVLVKRIEYMIRECAINPFSILAITFTNKAAREMYERIESNIGSIAESMWIGTFHAICSKILRRCIENIGYERNFIIYDTVDTKALLRECYKELNIDEKSFPMRLTQSEISKAKDNMVIPDMYKKIYKDDFRLSTIGQIYAIYQDKLKRNNALDFDDMILLTIKVFSEFPDILEEWQERFKYIMVDEYQDTNNAQYMLISMLTGKYRNLCVVGDDDQSIYKFRGANIENILSFEDEFPDALVIRLEQNYRSTKNILSAANAVIANNKGRKGKELWTEFEEGNKIEVFNAQNEHDEAAYIAKQTEMLKREGFNYSDISILYRMNSQSRVLEEAMMRMKIPYKVLAGLRFYDRREIKDIVAYLRVVHNTSDSVSLMRIINVPKRSIGATTLTKALKLADDNNTTLFDIVENADKYNELKSAKSKLVDFAKLIRSMQEQNEMRTLSEFVKYVTIESGYKEMCELSEDKSEIARIENIEEFVSVVAEFENDAINGGKTLAEFLERIALVSDVDNYDDESDSVTMMTIHSAKGLEFPIVFLPGLENGIFPGSQSMLQEEDMEEERRLCYVAITRAKKRLFISHAEMRMIYGKTMYQGKSQFLKEIPDEFIAYYSKRQKTSNTGFGRSVSDFLSANGMKKEIARGLNNYHNNLNDKKEQEVLNDRTVGQTYTVGQRVRHKIFGDGTVLAVQRFGIDSKLSIQFDSGQVKVLMAEYAGLADID